MKVNLSGKGKYVVAVSGGVDSAALLHLLKDMPDVDLVVAHFDHGIREDSRTDREFVQALADAYGLAFIYEEGRLGPGTSEAAAREARYDFLERVRGEHEAAAIVTAHHRDDVLETAVINMLRGSGRKGLTSLANRDGIERPLLDVPKNEILGYAKAHDLDWCEDSTNQNKDYLRNYVRLNILPRMDEAGREHLWQIISGLRTSNREIDDLLADQLGLRSGYGRLDRDWFIQLPHAVALEAMAAWLREADLRDFDAKTLERLVVAAKTSEPGKSFDVFKGARMTVAERDLALTPAER